ncbi:hypothetical protein [Sporosarcina sp. BP05]|nr:hypothetical protein [Sporosarcina sp. BP05]
MSRSNKADSDLLTGLLRKFITKRQSRVDYIVVYLYSEKKATLR